MLGIAGLFTVILIYAIPMFVDEVTDASATLPDKLRRAFKRRAEPWFATTLHIKLPHSMNDLSKVFTERTSRRRRRWRRRGPPSSAPLGYVGVALSALIVPVLRALPAHRLRSHRESRRAAHPTPLDARYLLGRPRHPQRRSRVMSAVSSTAERGPRGALRHRPPHRRHPPRRADRGDDGHACLRPLRRLHRAVCSSRCSMAILDWQGVGTRRSASSR